MDIATLYNANITNITIAKNAYDALATAFGQHVDAWQREVADRLAASHWTGDTSDKAQAEIRDLSTKLQAARQEISFVSRALADAAEAFAAAQSHLIKALDDAKAKKFNVAADGRITWDNEPTSANYAGDGAEAAAKDISKRITDALNEADHSDGEIAKRLNHLSHNATSGTGLDAGTAKADQDAIAALDQAPPAGTDPNAVKAWWNSLTDEQQHRFVLNHPDQIGNLDGIPAVTRDEANQIRMARTKQDLQTQLNQLGPEPPKTVVTPGGIITNPMYSAWKTLHDDAQEKLDSINTIESRLNGDKLKARDGRPAFLLGFDTTGKGRAIIAINNPDTADNVLTFVPGTHARFGQAPGDIDKADEMAKTAAEADRTKTTATIAWVGYDAPQNLVPEASSNSYAENAEKDLARFQTGLRTTHEGAPSHNTLMGHSYGSVTVGFTMRDLRPPVDDVILVGSPGVGVDHAKDLNIDPSHVYVCRGSEDTMIKNAARTGLLFGTDPVADEFGAQHLPAGDTDHSHYWKPGTPPVAAFGAVAAGKWTG
ncbi:alpha/beta hydrolase [Kitasatospora sp. NPDC056181]|uniref:alpha/beta hydrolase n=1 Tax=Kitasatospora sp. NPDC056181 TaxID=3345737 RepID=UPI0035E08B97